MNQYLEIFIEEAKEHLQNMNQSLLELENNHHDMPLVHEIFRIAHTLKGMSATMGFTKVASLTHEMENVLQLLRSEEMQLSESIVDLLFECLDTLEGYINEIVDTGNEGDIDSSYLVKKLTQVVTSKDFKEPKQDEHLESKQDQDHDLDGIHIEVEQFFESTIQKAIEEGFYAYKMKVELNPDCMLKAARAFIIFNTLEKECEILKSSPSVEDIEDEKFDSGFELIIISKTDENTIYEKITNISEVRKVMIESIKLNESIQQTDPEEVTKDEKDHEKDEKKVTDHETLKKNEGKTKKPRLGKTVRVDIDRLDNLMNLVSELIITRSRLEQIDESGKKHNMNEALEYLERITTSLHDAVMKVRMVPIERVFNRFPRMVRDLSKELGKEISLVMSGEETEVDRTVIDEIGDPLIHLIRNSIDHGIEDPQTRKEHGKSEIGTVKLIAYPDGNSVVIEVADDGQGINIKKVKQKAVEKGIVTKEQSESIDDQEAVNLLFESGFSTADHISDISGRGVGLDVVKTKIESLGGIVEVKTSDSGSRFTIRLPLTLAIIQALLVNVADEKYAIPLNSIKEIITINKESIRKVQNQEVVLYRNITLPILRMNEILEAESQNIQEDLIVVVAKKGDKIAGFVVDGLIGQQEIVIKSLGKYLSGIRAIAGATILGNGQVALIVDTNSLM